MHISGPSQKLSGPDLDDLPAPEPPDMARLITGLRILTKIRVLVLKDLLEKELTDREFVALCIRGLYGSTFQRIGDEIGASETTAGRRHRDAVQKLTQRLKASLKIPMRVDEDLITCLLNYYYYASLNDPNKYPRLRGLLERRNNIPSRTS